MAKEKKTTTSSKTETKASQPAKTSKEKKAPASSNARLPRSSEMVLTISKMVVLIMGVAVFGISLFRGVDPLMIMVRVAVTVLSLGFIFYFISWLFLRGTLEAALKPITDKEKMPNQGKQPNASESLGIEV